MNDDAAIVQRSLGEENAHREFRGERAIDLHAALGDALEILPALEGDQRAKLAVREIEGDPADEIERLPALVGCEENPMPAQRGEAAAQFRLEDDHERNDEHSLRGSRRSSR